MSYPSMYNIFFTLSLYISNGTENVKKKIPDRHPFPKLGPNPHAGVLHRFSYLPMTLDEAFQEGRTAHHQQPLTRKKKCPVSDKFLSLENIFILHLSAKIR